MALLTRNLEGIMMSPSRYWPGGLWRRVAAALRHINAEQTLMWELSWQAGRATVPKTGPLTWVPTLDGYRLAGDHLPTSDDIRTGGTP